MRRCGSIHHHGLHQLGRHEEAKDALEQLRGLMKTGKWADDDEARAFLREAEDLIAEASEPTNAAEERPLP